jgi:threonine dehydrogenase-like Zn-dependent dehydrogenase
VVRLVPREGRLVRALVVERPGVLVVTEVPDSPLGPGLACVDTRFSGVSLGTELTWFRGTNPAQHHRWDPELGLFLPALPVDPYPITKLGYMSVGVVTASRTATLSEGQTVAMTYGHRSGYTADPLRERVVPLPDDLDPMLGVFVAHMGPICANGLLHAAFDLMSSGVRQLGEGVTGREVLVVGAGVVGLLTALFARQHGAAEVVVVDVSEKRLGVAAALGFATLRDRGVENGLEVALQIKQRWAHYPGDRGASVVFQCRGQASALATALRCARPLGAVIDMAFYPAGAEEVRLGEEFHHNGLTLRCAQIARVPRGLSGAWDRERLSRATIDLLRTEGDAIRRHLVTDVVAFDDAPALFADVSERRRHVVGAVLVP